jgi:hypothetical protein
MFPVGVASLFQSRLDQSTDRIWRHKGWQMGTRDGTTNAVMSRNGNPGPLASPSAFPLCQPWYRCDRRDSSLYYKKCSIFVVKLIISMSVTCVTAYDCRSTARKYHTMADQGWN